MRELALAVAVSSLLGLTVAWTPPPPSPLTDYQKAMLDAAAPIARAASQAAEPALLKVFESAAWKRELRRLGDVRLAALLAGETLAELKRAMETVEYATSFGLSAANRIKQPGMASPNVSTIDDWGGVYPNQWQLKHYNSTLVSGLDANQWAIYDAGEVALYHLKPFAAPANHNPSWLETTERPTYVTINNRRQDLGNEPFGEYGMVYRGSVAKERAMVISGDSGEFENACNSTINTKRKWWWPLVERLAYHCEAMGGPLYRKLGWHPPAARPGMELHTLVQDPKMFTQSLPRYLGQILSEKADVVPLEMFFYTEAVILGSARMRDVKNIFASFNLFGTEEGDEFVAFCRRYKVPCTWGLGFQIGVEHWWNGLPAPLGRPKMPAGRARILEISTVPSTNSTAPTAAAQAVWKDVDTKVRAFRQANKEAPSISQVQAWWSQLAKAQTLLRPLRGIECPNTDLCLGTDPAGTCICRNDPDARAIMV